MTQSLQPSVFCANPSFSQDGPYVAIDRSASRKATSCAAHPDNSNAQTSALIGASKVKRCCQCRAEKDISEFGVLRASPDGHRYDCKECKSAAGRKYNAANKEKIRAYHAKRYADPEKRARHLKVSKNGYEKNKEKRIAQTSSYRASRREFFRKWHHDHWKNNKDKYNARNKAWRAANPEKAAALRRRSHENWKRNKPDHYKMVIAAGSHKRRALKQKASGKFTNKDISTLLVLQRGKCAVCLADISGGYQIDHIMPLVRGGSNDPTNLQLLCQPCNGSKHAKHPVEFMQSRGFLL